jgi:hypothetical protein
MQSARITPNRNSLPGPVHPRDAVMVSGNEPHHIVSDHLVLVGIHVIDPRHMETNSRKNRFPARHGMRSNDWMRWRKLVSHVQGRATRGRDIVPTSLGGTSEDGLGACRRQRLQVAAEGRRHAIISIYRQSGFQ